MWVYYVFWRDPTIEDTQIKTQQDGYSRNKGESNSRGKYYCKIAQRVRTNLGEREREKEHRERGGSKRDGRTLTGEKDDVL